MSIVSGLLAYLLAAFDMLEEDAAARWLLLLILVAVLNVTTELRRFR